MADEDRPQEEQGPPHVSIAELVPSKSQIQGLVSDLFKSVQMDSIKGRLGDFILARNQMADRVEAKRQDLNAEQRKLDLLNERLEKIANGEVQLLDVPTTVICVVCRGNYLSSHHITCPYCEAKRDVTDIPVYGFPDWRS